MTPVRALSKFGERSLPFLERAQKTDKRDFMSMVVEKVRDDIDKARKSRPGT